MTIEEKDQVGQALELYFQRAQEVNRKVNAREPIGSEQVRDLAWVTALVLRAYCLPSNWHGEYGTNPVTPLPPQLVADIARQIQIICGGHIPVWMLHMQKRGAPPIDPRIREWQGIAVAYVKLCKSGSIFDRSPSKTVADAYGIDRKSVQNWVNTLQAEPMHFFPNAGAEKSRAEMIEMRMRECGSLYRLWGPAPKNARPFGKGRKRPRAKR